MKQPTHYYAFNFRGFSAHPSLSDCIKRQLLHNGGCNAVVKVIAPPDAEYSIEWFIPKTFSKTGTFKPGEQVDYYPVAAPHADVGENYRQGCVDSTDWTTEQWNEFAATPAINQCEFYGFKYPTRELNMPDGTVWTVSNEATMGSPGLPATVDGKIAYYFPDDDFNSRSDAELIDEIGDCT